MRSVAVLLCLAAAAVSGEEEAAITTAVTELEGQAGSSGESATNRPLVVNQNEYLDQQILKLNEQLNGWGIGMRLLPKETTIAGAKVKNGVLIGLDSLQRTKDATEVKAITKGYFDVWLGARFLNLGYGQIITPEGKKMSAVFRSRGSSFHFEAMMDYSRGCKFNVSHYEFETLGEVMMDSSLPEYDGKNMTDFFAKEVLPVLNSWSEENKPFVENLLQFLCEHWKLPTDPPLVSYVIRLITTYLFQRV